MKDISIVKFTEKKQILSAYKIINQFYDKMDVTTYENYVDEMMEGNNYNMVGIYLEEELIGVVSYWVLTRFYCGRYIQIGNMVVDKRYRNLGIGSTIIDYMEEEGRKRGCKKFILDSYTENKESHRMYFRKGFFIEGFHFMKDIV